MVLALSLTNDLYLRRLRVLGAWWCLGSSSVEPELLIEYEARRWWYDRVPGLYDRRPEWRGPCGAAHRPRGRRPSSVDATHVFRTRRVKPPAGLTGLGKADPDRSRLSMGRGVLDGRGPYSADGHVERDGVYELIALGLRE